MTSELLEQMLPVYGCIDVKCGREIRSIYDETEAGYLTFMVDDDKF